jgi:hypothetical protein
VELLHESVHPDEGQSLPGYRGALGRQGRQDLATAVAEAISLEARPVTSLRIQAQRRDRVAWGQCFAAAALAVACCILAVMLSGNRRSGLFQRPPASLKTRLGAVTLDLQGLETLVAMKLPDACFDSSRLSSPRPIKAESDGESRSLHTFLCCSHCHSAAASLAPQPPLTSVALVASSCQLCHQ